MTQLSPARAVIAKVGLDGHDVGARTIARGLRDAGMEVVYTGIRQSPETIVSTVVQEDADVLGLSILSGSHLHYVPRVIELLAQHGADDVVVIVGGVIPDNDVPALLAMGVAGVFHSDSRIADVIEFLADRLGERNTRKLV